MGKGAVLVQVRLATVNDMDAIVELVEEFSRAGALLPRSRDSLMHSLGSLVVAYDDGDLIGVAALHKLEHSVGEVRSLAVRDGYQGRGVGQALVRFTVNLAQQAGLAKVICFTRQVSFFERCGFVTVARETIPGKYFIDCVNCPKLSHCDETAMERVLTKSFAQPYAQSAAY